MNETLCCKDKSNPEISELGNRSEGIGEKVMTDLPMFFMHYDGFPYAYFWDFSYICNEIINYDHEQTNISAFLRFKHDSFHSGSVLYSK